MGVLKVGFRHLLSTLRYLVYFHFQAIFKKFLTYIVLKEKYM